MNLPVDTAPSHEHTTTPDLVKQVLSDARELISLEVKLAVDDAKGELLKTKRAAIAGGVAIALAVLFLEALLLALVLALGGTPVDAVIVAGVLLVATALCAWYAYSSVPKRPLERTRARLKDDVERVKEHVA